MKYKSENILKCGLHIRRYIIYIDTLINHKLCIMSKNNRSKSILISSLARNPYTISIEPPRLIDIFHNVHMYRNKERPGSGHVRLDVVRWVMARITKGREGEVEEGQVGD